MTMAAMTTTTTTMTTTTVSMRAPRRGVGAGARASVGGRGRGGWVTTSTRRRAMTEDDDDAVDGGGDDGETTTTVPTGSVKDKPKDKPLPGSGVNLYDPAATASRWLTRRFGIVGGLGFVALLASVEGGEIVKALLERDSEGSNETFDLDAGIDGLTASDSRIGGGVSPKKGDFVGLNLVVTDKEDGTEYINTKKNRRPIAFTYEKKPLIPPVCQAIEEGVRTMKRGGVRRVNAPSATAYGERGVVLNDGTRIPGNRDLIIDITLEEVSPSYV